MCLGVVMYDNEFKTKENKIYIKNKMEPQHICWRDYQPLFGKRDGAPPLPEERSERGLNSHAVIVIISAPKRGGEGGPEAAVVLPSAPSAQSG